MELLHPGTHVAASACCPGRDLAAVGEAELEPGSDTPVIDTISSDEDSVRRLVGWLDAPGLVRACYEAGPTGYELARLLHAGAVPII